jgi:hypothetical protein
VQLADQELLTFPDNRGDWCVIRKPPTLAEIVVPSERITDLSEEEAVVHWENNRPTGGRNCCAMKKQLCEGNYCTMKEPPTYRWMKELYPLGNQRHTGEETVASCENSYVEETIVLWKNHQPTDGWKSYIPWVTNDIQVKKLLHHVKTAMWRKLLYHEKTDGGESYSPWVTNDIQVT